MSWKKVLGGRSAGGWRGCCDVGRYVAALAHGIDGGSSAVGDEAFRFFFYMKKVLFKRVKTGGRASVSATLAMTSKQ